jgi:hypothetical protein
MTDSKVWMWQKLYWQNRPLAVQLHEHRHNLWEGLLEKLKLAQHAYEEGHTVGWDEARILEIESNSKYSKYKELAHMTCLNNPISQPSLDISPIWIPWTWFVADPVSKVLCSVVF